MSLSIPIIDFSNPKSVVFGLKIIDGKLEYLAPQKYLGYYASQLSHYSINGSKASEVVDNYDFADWQLRQLAVLDDLADAYLEYFGLDRRKVPPNYSPTKKILFLKQNRRSELREDQIRKLNISLVFEFKSAVIHCRVYVQDKLNKIKPEYLKISSRKKTKHEFSLLEAAYALYYLVESKSYKIKHPKTKTWSEFATLSNQSTFDRIKKEYPKLQDREYRLTGRSSKIESSIRFLNKFFPGSSRALIIAQNDLKDSILK